MSAFFMLTCVGLGGYLIPLRAVQEGWSTFQISLIATGYALAFTLGCTITPQLVLRVGHIRVFAVLAAAMSISLLMHALVVNSVAWILFRGIAGFSIAGAYMVMESWLNERVTNETHGTVFSVYMAISMVAVMAGQFIVPLGDPGTATLFMISAIVFALALMPTGLSSAQSPQPLTQVSVDLKGLYRKSPAAAVGSGRHHLRLVEQPGARVCAGRRPLDRAGRPGARNRDDRRRGVSDTVGPLFGPGRPTLRDDLCRRRRDGFLPGRAIVGIGNIYLFLAAMFFLGSVLFPIYALNVAHANDFAAPEEFVAVSGGLLIIYGVGTMLEPLFAGAMMDNFGSSSLFAVIGTAFSVSGLYAYYRTFRREQASEKDRTDFQAIPLTRAQTPQTYELDPRVDQAT